MGGVLTTVPTDLLLGTAERSGLDVASFVALILGDVHADDDHPWHRLERGEITIADYDAAVAAMAAERDLPGIPSLPDSEVMREALQPVPAMLELAREVRAAGYRTAIVTNNIREWEWWIGVVDGHRLVDVVVESCRVGLRKPSGAIFDHTLERLGVSAERAVFLDDFPWNVEGARRHGLATIGVSDHRRAEEELRGLLGL